MRKLDRIIESQFFVLVGDANGADRSVQQYLSTKNYRNVEVFCAGRICRNNVGGWRTREIHATAPRGTYAFYAAKDQAMAEEAEYGFMLWDGKSVGTLLNVARLLEQHKKVVFYSAPERDFLEFHDRAQWLRFVEKDAPALKGAMEDKVSMERAERYVLPMNM
ncbi:MAG TPA: hypothetical protein VIN40_04890 [Candidatus Tyrphobacter sp.]